jgi:hypothetical protein
MTHEQAAERIEEVMAHLWMVRTFLKHAEEIQEDADFLEVPRGLFDYTRAVEPAALKKDWPLYLHRARSKLGKLRKVVAFFAENYPSITNHTNWQMAAASMKASVRRIEEILAAVTSEPTSTAAVPVGEGVLAGDEVGDDIGDALQRQADSVVEDDAPGRRYASD